ncbi:unnamed protein product [Nesidiocoris tenuis]|uniref:Uncharacterized protein n=1 Tax=Nesidiocoris tenuis TaxID=355587 RepID=A0A6H5GH96_9HEMI|nr:unnamed protein product [Nesidiocoris tenuis]
MFRCGFDYEFEFRFVAWPSVTRSHVTMKRSPSYSWSLLRSGVHRRRLIASGGRIVDAAFDADQVTALLTGERRLLSASTSTFLACQAVRPRFSEDSTPLHGTD